jgi:hypothetical protein
MSKEEWRSKAGPWARAVMPDGQELDVIVTARTRTRDGRWWYECQAVLPARYEDADGRTRVTGAPTDISILADDITPVPGQDYAAVPTGGAVAGRQWVVERLHQYLDGPSRRLHRRDCWQARDSHTRITTREATALLRDASISVCDVCCPEQALRADARSRPTRAPPPGPRNTRSQRAMRVLRSGWRGRGPGGERGRGRRLLPRSGISPGHGVLRWRGRCSRGLLLC